MASPRASTTSPPPSPSNLNNNNNHPPPSSSPPSGVRKCGYLRKQKHGHKRFFVLLGGPAQPARLEYYDSEKKWRSKAPKRVISLASCLNVHKRADAKHKYLIALYTRDEYLAVAADDEREQDGWYRALAELMTEGQEEARGLPGGGGASSLPAGFAPDDPHYREVWQVTVKPKGLGQARHLTGVHRLCLSARTVGFVRLNRRLPSVTLQLMNIRRCGHSDSFFFIEVGRSAATGPGELWMQADDAVVAQNIHETILDAMKALKEPAGFRPRSKSQSAATRPISVPAARPPRRARLEDPTAAAAAAAARRARTASEGDGGKAKGLPPTAGSPASPSPSSVWAAHPCPPPTCSGSGSPSDPGFSSLDEDAPRLPPPDWPGGYVRMEPARGPRPRTSSLSGPARPCPPPAPPSSASLDEHALSRPPAGPPTGDCGPGGDASYVPMTPGSGARSPASVSAPRLIVRAAAAAAAVRGPGSPPGAGGDYVRMFGGADGPALPNGDYLPMAPRRCGPSSSSSGSLPRPDRAPADGAQYVFMGWPADAPSHPPRASPPTRPRPVRPTRLALGEPRTAGPYVNIDFGEAAASPPVDYVNLGFGSPDGGSPSPPGGDPAPALGRLSLREGPGPPPAGPPRRPPTGPPDPHRGARVVRADPQGGRRRHSSETFSAPAAAGAPAFAHRPKRHNSASVDNVSPRKAPDGAAPAPFDGLDYLSRRLKANANAGPDMHEISRKASFPSCSKEATFSPSIPTACSASCTEKALLFDPMPSTTVTVVGGGKSHLAGQI
ncbi:insulin receptor substrate 2 [Tachyglossus aculeatus]|uniref:insulin receptor substrate 2 n=1 Tax=Tachyglossus aculeatus TaxID=9261 RepID=UPI0018F3A5AC|nr:insulin receptor substrate 2 [Tachyglossus aculeatus]